MLSSLMHFSSFIIPETVQMYTRYGTPRRTPLTVIHENRRPFFPLSATNIIFQKLYAQRKQDEEIAPLNVIWLFRLKEVIDK